MSGLSPSSTYYYRAKVVNGLVSPMGDSVSVIPAHYWELNDTGSIAIDEKGGIDGEIFGATSFLDLNRGRVLSFDGDNDYVNLGDINEMDQIDRFTLSLWFNRNQTASSRSTNHGVDNVLVAQSSQRSNDNFEIGTHGF